MRVIPTLLLPCLLLCFPRYLYIELLVMQMFYFIVSHPDHYQAQVSL